MWEKGRQSIASTWSHCDRAFYQKEESKRKRQDRYHSWLKENNEQKFLDALEVVKNDVVDEYVKSNEQEEVEDILGNIFKEPADEKELENEIRDLWDKINN